MKPIYCVLLIWIVAGLVSSCKTGQIKTQGIKGQVNWIEGNQMPMVSENKDHQVAVPKGVKRTIRIHGLTHLEQANLGDALFGDIETELIAELETDETGYFQIELPEGTYSIFTVEKEGYFANVFDKDNFIHPVVVQKGKWANIEVLINYKAVY